MRYFFDVSSDRLQTRDEEGCELANETLMQSEARRILAEIAEDEARFHSHAVFTARVRDAAGTPVYHAVLTLEGQKLQ
jgi:hypothetical protein